MMEEGEEYVSSVAILKSFSDFENTFCDFDSGKNVIVEYCVCFEWILRNQILFLLICSC